MKGSQNYVSQYEIKEGNYVMYVKLTHCGVNLMTGLFKKYIYPKLL